jgi:hypothetical protein
MYKGNLVEKKKRGGGKEALKEARRKFIREPTCPSAGSDMLTTPPASNLMDCRI